MTTKTKTTTRSTPTTPRTKPTEPRTANSRIQAWRKAAGYATAEAAVTAFSKRYKTKPGKDGCPTVASWRTMEQTNGRVCGLRRLLKVAALLGVGCPLRMRTAWPEGFVPSPTSSDFLGCTCDPKSLETSCGCRVPSRRSTRPQNRG